MLTWIQANLATLVVGGMVFGVWLGVVIKLIRDRRAGKGGCSCGGSCSGCPGSKYCHSK